MTIALSTLTRTDWAKLLGKDAGVLVVLVAVAVNWARDTEHQLADIRTDVSHCVTVEQAGVTGGSAAESEALLRERLSKLETITQVLLLRQGALHAQVVGEGTGGYFPFAPTPSLGGFPGLHQEAADLE